MTPPKAQMTTNEKWRRAIFVVLIGCVAYVLLMLWVSNPLPAQQLRLKGFTREGAQWRNVSGDGLSGRSGH